ncbi:MAG: filamentous hemagglutinin N-terminal domain-containing protein [Hassallia sp.]
MSGLRSTHWGWFLGIAIGSISSANCAIAQITPDGSLPNNSRVTTQNNISNIDRGTQAGSNLFHSFLQFSLPNSADVANFQTIPAINNVIVRVTGVGTPFISNINGTIQTSNPANFFLLNPNGIIFGRGATLNVGGAFLGTTASRLNFQDGTQFSTTDPTPLLTITAPIGLGLTQGAGNITVQSSLLSAGDTNNFSDFVLVGGNVSLDNTTLQTPGGRVELGGLAEAGTVGLNVNGNNLSLSFPDAVARADVSLKNGTEVNVLAGGGASIAVNARNLDILGDSTILAGIEQGLGTVDSVAGDLTINATGEIKVVGENSNIFNAVLPQALGKGGNLIINTQQLLVQDGAQVGAITFGAGNAGNFTLTANNVQVIGSGSGLFNYALGSGNGGDLTINTPELEVRDGAEVSAGTFGAGKGGNFTLTANNVQVIGSGSGLFNQANQGSTGNAGDLTINTRELEVRDGAEVSAGTFGAGNGGNLTLNTRDLEVRDGAAVSATTFGAGKGGNLTLTANNVQVIGSDSGLFTQANRGSTGNAGDLTINTRELEVRDGAVVSATTFGAGKGGNLTLTANKVQLIGSDGGLFTQADPGSTGNAGDLTINTPELEVRDGAQVSAGTGGAGKGGNLTLNANKVQLIGSGSGLFTGSVGSTGNAGDLTINTQQLLVQDGAGVLVNSLGTGTAGNLTVNARSIRLDNNAILTANTRSNRIDPNREQATITLRARDLILTRGSNITTNARGSNVIGGNININTDVLAAVESSNIRANSANSRGGRVIITTQGFVLSPDSTITATGANPELNGTVEINTPDIDPTQGLTKLPASVVNTPRLVSSSCAAFADRGGSKFTVTGRGGLPPSPDDFLSPDVVWSDARLLATTAQQHKPKTPAAKPSSKPNAIAIVPATGWVINDKGEVTLISSVSNATNFVSTPVTCPNR